MTTLIRARSLKVALAVAALACGGGGGDYGGITNPPPPSPPTNPPAPPSGSASVTLGAASFTPSSVSITANGTVTWNNTSGLEHNVTFAAANGAPMNIGNHISGSNSRTFGVTGTFSYSCTLHGGMNGAVTVQ